MLYLPASTNSYITRKLERALKLIRYMLVIIFLICYITRKLERALKQDDDVNDEEIDSSYITRKLERALKLELTPYQNLYHRCYITRKLERALKQHCLQFPYQLHN